MRQFDRRTLLGIGPLTLAGCGTESPYFGNTQPPSRQQLICALAAPYASLDPAKAGVTTEAPIVRAIFEGLTNLHPRTMEPMAGLATHHETSPDGMQVKLFLRGHSHPRGIQLPDSGTLLEERRNGGLLGDFSRGRPAASHRVPVRWTDGTPVTAHDVVYSWRRVLDPATASMQAYLLNCIRNAQAVTKGELAPDKLAVRALDDFSLQVDLRAPIPFFLNMLSTITLFPVPRQAIEAARRRGDEDRWTEPGSIVTSGAFTLREYRSRDRIVVARNADYYEAAIVALEEVSFLLTPEVATCVNLYKSGRAHVMPGVDLPPLVVPALSGKRDLYTAPAFGAVFPCFNTTRPPFDNVLLRYAFNMAVDKNAVPRVFGFGRQPARTLVPPLSGYHPPDSVLVRVGGASYDVLEFNPAGARKLLASAGFPGGRDSEGGQLTIDLLCPSFQETRLKAEILQSQWQVNLSVKVRVVSQEFKTLLQNIYALNYHGVTDNADWGSYLDPTWFLDQFVTGSSGNVSGWADPQYDAMLEKANATLEPTMRMERLAECERYMLRAMPLIPLYHDVWAYPQKPYVRGIVPNVMDVHPLKYASIDTNWRPS